MRYPVFQSIAPMAIAAILLPLGLGLFQEPAEKQGEEEDRPSPSKTPDEHFFGPRDALNQVSPLRKRMEGLWRITQVIDKEYPQEGQDLLGYVLISDHFISLELQAYWDDTLDESPSDAFETFTAEYRFNGERTVEARVLIGSYIDRDEGKLEWYKGNRPRRFIVTSQGENGLILEWSEQRSMILTRHVHNDRASRNFFGALDPALSLMDDFYNDAPDVVDDEPVLDEEPEEPELPDDDGR